MHAERIRLRCGCMTRQFFSGGARTRRLLELLHVPQLISRKGGAYKEDSAKRSLSFHRLDLEEVFAKPGCAVCLLLKRYDFRSLDALLYECVNDVLVRDMIRRLLGFCNYHSSVMEQIATSVDRDLLSASGASLGIGIIYLDLVETFTKQLKLDPTVYRASASSQMERELCPLCSRRGELEHAYLKTILQNIADSVFREKYSTSDGLCATHLITALRLQDSLVSTRERLVSIEIEHLERLAEELHEFIRKHDYRYSKEGFGKEADSWLRALRKVSGEPFATTTRRGADNTPHGIDSRFPSTK